GRRPGWRVAQPSRACQAWRSAGAPGAMPRHRRGLRPPLPRLQLPESLRDALLDLGQGRRGIDDAQALRFAARQREVTLAHLLEEPDGLRLEAIRRGALTAARPGEAHP